MCAYIPHTEGDHVVYLDICFYTSQRPNFPHFSSQYRPGVCLLMQKWLANNPPALHILLTKSDTHWALLPVRTWDRLCLRDQALRWTFSLTTCSIPWALTAQDEEPRIMEKRVSLIYMPWYLSHRQQAQKGDWACGRRNRYPRDWLRRTKSPCFKKASLCMVTLDRLPELEGRLAPQALEVWLASV